MADSRPDPGPLTYTSTVRIPASIALRAAVSAVTPAAYGVLLREPLKPLAPAEPQAIGLPVWSVMVTMVLLNVAWTCALPRGTLRRSLRRGRAAPRLRSAMLS